MTTATAFTTGTTRYYGTTDTALLLGTTKQCWRLAVGAGFFILACLFFPYYPFYY